MARQYRSNRSRLTLDLAPRANERLKRAAERRGCTRAEALRGGLELLFKMDKAGEEGFTVGFYGYKDGVRIECVYIGI